MTNGQPLAARVTFGEGGSVVLPCEPDNFRDFISGLLGRPQTIARLVENSFEARKPDIENLYYLVEQRVLRQNQGSLVSFSATTSYENGSSVTQNSLDDFLAYNEIKPLKSMAVHLNWTWLIHYPGRQAPEKQEIDVSLLGTSLHKKGDIIVIDDVGRYISRTGGMYVRIAHTDRSWGSDIESMITGSLETLSVKHGKIREFFRKNAAPAGFALGTAFAASLLTGVVTIFVAAARTHLLDTSKMWSGKNMSAASMTSAKLDYLLSKTATYSSIEISTMFIFLVAVAAASAGLGFLTYSYLVKRRSSFVLFTKQSEEAREAVLQEEKGELWRVAAMSILSFAVAILARIASNQLPS